MLPPLSTQEHYLPLDHPLTVGWDLSKNAFHNGKDGAKLSVEVMWGVKDKDDSNAAMWDPDDLGEIIWDDEFDMSPEDS